MEISYTDASGSTWTEDGVTLAEETDAHLYIEYSSDSPHREEGATLTCVDAGCQTIGLVDVPADERGKVPTEYIDVDDAELILTAEYAEQRGEQVYIEFAGTESVHLTGTLDRGYAY